MAKESDISLFNDVLEPFRRVINTDPLKDKVSASPKLNFSDSNHSIKEGLDSNISFGKRKLNLSGDINSPVKRVRTDSNASQLTPSPWEAKKLKIDLIAAKAQISKLEARVNHQHAIRKEMQILFEDEKSSLIEQHKRDEKAVSDLEDKLQLVRRREQELKEEQQESIKEFKESKMRWDKDKTELQKQIAELKDKLLEANVSSKDQISEMKKDMDELLQALEGAQQEVDILKIEVAKQTQRAEQCTSLRTQLEKQTFELQQITNKLKELEYEKDSYKDWQQQTKTAQNRLTNMAELEKEVIKLRATERSLRDAVCNKLLLEEQVHVLTAKVEALQPVQNELHEAKVKIASLESALDLWASAARAHGVESARALGAALDAALSGQLAATAGCGEAQSQRAELAEEMATMKFERDKAVSKLSDIQAVRKNQESLIHRLQKRLSLVTRERDSYRQQLDSYERELSVTLSGDAGAGSASLLSARVEQLEKTLQSYREMLATHDQESHLKALDSVRAEVSKYREEAELARREASKLRSQRDTLQAHVDRLVASTTPPAPQGRILHLSENPAALAEKKVQLDLEAAKEEIKSLKAALQEGGSYVNIEEIRELQQQIERGQVKQQRMKQQFVLAAQDYRHVTYMLLGYKIDKSGHNIYRLKSMYSESSEDYLLFNVDDNGIQLGQTEFSDSVADLVSLHLHQNHSIPLFLSALTMELFTRRAMQLEGQDC